MAPYWGTPPKLLLMRAVIRKPFAPELFRTTTCGLGEADAAPFVAKRCKPRLPSPTRIPEDKEKGPPAKTRSPLIRLLVSAHIASDMSFAQEPIPRVREAVLQTGCCTKCRSFIGSFPSEFWLLTTKVAVSRCLGVDGTQQVEHLNDALGAQVKVLSHQC